MWGRAHQNTRYITEISLAGVIVRGLDAGPLHIDAWDKDSADASLAWGEV
jgi:hypothetical protein